MVAFPLSVGRARERVRGVEERPFLSNAPQRGRFSGRVRQAWGERNKEEMAAW